MRPDRPYRGRTIAELYEVLRVLRRIFGIFDSEVSSFTPHWLRLLPQQGTFAKQAFNQVQRDLRRAVAHVQRGVEFHEVE